MVDHVVEQNCIGVLVENVDIDISMMAILTNSFNISYFSPFEVNILLVHLHKIENQSH